MARKLFCQMHPAFYAISVKKEVAKRHLKNLAEHPPFAVQKQAQALPNLVSSYSCVLIKRGKDIDPVHQENKAHNIRLACARLDGLVIHPGEVFSFWKVVGKTAKARGYRAGRVLIGNRLTAGVGGGLCNLGNTIHLLALHSPMTVTEFHQHSDALAPDHGKRVPFSSGTSVSYNYLDYRFRNDTNQDVQLRLWCDAEKLYGELRSVSPFPYSYHLEEEDHHFRKEGQNYYRLSKIYKLTTDPATGQTLDKTLVLDNHSKVLFDHSEIPQELVRQE